MSRIIAGSAKGRRLATPKGDRTRPTTSRVREALFSALASWFGTADDAPDEHLAGLAVLDLFGGSGAIGLEAASRGAKRVTIVESDAPTARLIAANARDAKLNADVVTGRLPGAIGSVQPGFDLVFADPPYDLSDAILDHLLEALAAEGFLLQRALVVVERATSSGTPHWPDIFTDVWERGYGETTLYFGATK